MPSDLTLDELVVVLGVENKRLRALGERLTEQLAVAVDELRRSAELSGVVAAVTASAVEVKAALETVEEEG